MITVVTALFGGGLELLDPDSRAAGVRHVAFTDDPAITSRVWEVRLVPRDPRTTPRRQAKRYKVLAHEYFPDSDYTLWLDSRVTLKVDPRERLEPDLAGCDLAVFPHPSRRCVYEEAEACAAAGDDLEERIRAQMERYRSEGYPARNGLAVCGILLRRHTPAIQRFNEAWWTEIERGSVRDQLSFDYVCWRLGVKYRTLPGTCFENELLRYEPQATVPEPERLRGRGRRLL